MKRGGLLDWKALWLWHGGQCAVIIRFSVFRWFGVERRGVRKMAENERMGRFFYNAGRIGAGAFGSASPEYGKSERREPLWFSMNPRRGAGNVLDPRQRAGTAFYVRGMRVGGPRRAGIPSGAGGFFFRASHPVPPAQVPARDEPARRVPLAFRVATGPPAFGGV